MRFLLPLFLSGCYTLESYWEDVADVHCHCLEPSAKETCVSEQMAALEDEGLLEACGDEPPPASWREMLKWRQEYTAACDLSEATPPGADAALPETCD
ncbi:MAG: hypothetical protein VXW32_01170 [Myxococcota bacterium]|jgi:hypothetical protein|nr:hypothetical protein [Myxococcota bacterium]